MTVRLFLILVGVSLGQAANAQKTLILSDAKVAPDAQKIAFSAAEGPAFSVYEQSLLANSKATKVSAEAPGFQHVQVEAP